MEVKIVRRGNILFVQGKGILGNLIRLVDKGTYSHCAIVVSDKHVIESDYDTSVAVVRFDSSEYRIIDEIDLGLTHEQRKAVHDKALEYVGKKYDYVQLIWYVIRKIFKLKGKNPLNNPNNIICSELIFLVLSETGILKDLGIEDTFKYGNDLTPNELYDLVKFVSKK
jgi:uncharacterized protein YycO